MEQHGSESGANEQKYFCSNTQRSSMLDDAVRAVGITSYKTDYTN